MTDIAALLREARKLTHWLVNNPPDIQPPILWVMNLDSRLEAAAEAMPEPTAYILTKSDGLFLDWEPDDDAIEIDGLYLAPPAAGSVPDEMVPMPRNADQAQGMYLVAYHWLRANAPDRLAAASPDGEAGDSHE